MQTNSAAGSIDPLPHNIRQAVVVGVDGLDIRFRGDSRARTDAPGWLFEWSPVNLQKDVILLRVINDIREKSLQTSPNDRFLKKRCSRSVRNNFPPCGLFGFAFGGSGTSVVMQRVPVREINKVLAQTYGYIADIDRIEMLQSRSINGTQRHALKRITHGTFMHDSKRGK